MRHLDYYLKWYPLPKGLNAEHAIQHVRKHRGEDWQKRQVIEVLQILFTSHGLPLPTGLYSASLPEDSNEPADHGALPEDPDEAKLVRFIRYRHLAFTTERTYRHHWRKFAEFCGKQRPCVAQLENYLSHLAVEARFLKALNDKS